MSTTTASSSGPSVLVVDDEPLITKVLSEFLELEGYKVDVSHGGNQALQKLRTTAFDAVITDLKMPGVTGLELLDSIKAEQIDTVTLVMTGYGTVETAIQAMKRGAYDYVLKPFKMEDVLSTLSKALTEQRLAKNAKAPKEAQSIFRVAEAISSSLEIDDVLEIIISAVLDESSADMVSIHLADPKTGNFDERIKKATDHVLLENIPTPHHKEILSVFDTGHSILADGSSAHRYFTEKNVSNKLKSFLSIPITMTGKISGSLNVFSLTEGKSFSKQCHSILKVLATKAGVALENAQLYDDLQHKNERLTDAQNLLDDNYQQTILGFAQALEESDHYTRGHSERVSIYSGLIAEGLSLPPEEIRTIVRAGLMHDIGKLGLRYEMLNKPGPLNTDEKILFREHPIKGKRILQTIPCMRNLVDAAWCHHEFFNGGGYPRGISGHQIPLSGRIVQIADAYDAMTSDRAYRKALSHDVAVQELVRCAGTQFDPEIVDVFMKVIESYRKNDYSNGGKVTLRLVENFEKTNKTAFI